MTTTPGDLPDLAGLPLFAARPTTAPPPPAPQVSPPTPITSRRRPGTGATPGAAAPELDWTLVRALRGTAAKELSEALANRSGVDPVETRALGEQIVTDLVRTHTATANAAGLGTDRVLAGQLRSAVLDALFGLGRLQPLVDNLELEDIEIYGHDRTVLIWADGRRTPGPPIADSDEELIEELAFQAARAEASQRTFSPAAPLLNLRLDGGARLAAHAWVSRRPVAVIRLHRLAEATLPDLVSRSMMSPEVHDLLVRAVRHKLAVVLVGGQGAGKTTLLRAVCAEFDPWESVGTIETEFELHLDEFPERHYRVHAVEMRPGSGEHLADGTVAGEVSLTDLTRAAWRWNLDRIILGEVRGPEIMEMFNIMGGGAGSLCTVHANSAQAGIQRMKHLAMGAGPQVSPAYAEGMVAGFIDLVVHIGVAHLPGGAKHRYISEVLAVEHAADGLKTTTVFKAGPDRVARLVLMPPHLADALDL